MSEEMTDQTVVRRRRVKLGTTVDPELIRAVDAYVARRDGVDRSDVIDEALRLWCARRQDEAMQAQFAIRPTKRETTERRAWARVQRAAARRVLGRR